MPRRKVIAFPKAFKCKVCPKQFFTERGLAQHLAMKKDKKHRNWRKEHDLPEDYKSMKEVMEMIPKIIELLQSNNTLN